MNKKITAVMLSALLLTACQAEEQEQQLTGTTVTTPLTLTEIFTTETSFEPEPEEEKQLIELAVSNPFEDSVKIEDNLYAELVKRAEEAYDNLESYFDLFTPSPKKAYITYYDEKSFKAVVVEYGEYPFNSFHFDFAEENGEWVVEEWNMQTYFIREYSMLYDIFILNHDKWNAILCGNVDKNALSVTIGDGEYKPSDTGMTLDEMRKFFEKNLGEEICEEYKQKYIEDVYAVLDSKLYRRDGAPEWYMPEVELDVFNIGMIRWGSVSVQSNDDEEEIRLNCFDPVTEENFDYPIVLITSRETNLWEYDEENNTCIFPYYRKYINSELPIKTLE